MKRIKLCWSIARIINAHTDTDTDSEGKNKYAGLYIYKYKYIYKTDYQGTQEHLLSGLTGGLGQTAKCWQNKRQQPSVASDSAAGVDTNFSSPYPKPLSHPPAPVPTAEGD